MDYIKELHELCETVADEISDANKKIRTADGKLSAGDVEYLDKLTHMMKSLKTTIAMEEANDEGGYSGMYPRYYPGSYADGRNRGRSYDDGRSYARRRDSMGRYSRRYEDEEMR